MVEVVDVLEAKCHYCSSKPCLLFGPFEHKSLQQRRIVQCKKVKLRSCRWPPVFQKKISFVLGKIWLLWLLIWHFMASGMFFKFGTSHHVAADLLVLGATLVVRMGRFGHLFLGKSGVNSTGLCLRENFSIIFCPKSMFIVSGVLFTTVWGFHCLDATETIEAAQLWVATAV